jgi:hypothetical protein
MRVARVLGDGPRTRKREAELGSTFRHPQPYTRLGAWQVMVACHALPLLRLRENLPLPLGEGRGEGYPDRLLAQHAAQ